MFITRILNPDLEEYYSYDETYEDIYDEQGDEVLCDRCREPLKWHEGSYTCPCCGQTMSRAEFFNYIGANPPSPKCLKCSDSYPNCVFCPYEFK